MGKLLTQLKKLIEFRKQRTKSIKNQIQFQIVFYVLVVSLILGMITSYLNYKSTLSTLEITLNEVTETAAKLVASELKEIEIIAEETGQLTKLTDDNISMEEKSILFQLRIQKNGYLDAYYADQNGNALTTVGKNSINISNTDYYKASLAGNTFVSEPIFDNENSTHFIVSAPLWKDGEYGSTVVGVIVLEIDGKELTNIVSGIELGEGGIGVIMDKNGYTIAHPEYERVLSRENAIELGKTNSVFEKLADLEQKMINGELNYGSYEMNGVRKLVSYVPIEGTNGWGLMINTLQDQYLTSTLKSILYTGLIIIVFVIVALVAGGHVAKRISAPIIACTQRLELLSNGDLHTEVPKTTNDDETGILLNSLSLTIERLKIVINDISYHLGSMSNGDLTTTLELEYIGDFEPIHKALIKLNIAYNHKLREIIQSAEQIASGSEQVASGAQILSQGATEQASSIEELAATINEITEQIKSNASNADKAKEISLEAGKVVEEGNYYVREMSQAMNEITNTSRDIAKIIKVIDDIAFQTNILALNAAVEAARAGSAGKGFSVVADEVRNLASKSAEAAKSTTDLIENSLKSVSQGNSISVKTKEALELAVERVNSSIKMIEQISIASGEQATGASQVTVGIDQISAVVQTNSATSEESAAASEELSSQAQVLKDVVEGVKLKELATS